MDDPTSPADRAAVSDAIPVACRLDEGDLAERLDQWQAMLAQAIRREVVDGGVRLTFPRALDVIALTGLVEAEQTCCAWMTFRLTVAIDAVTLEVSGPDDGRELIEAVFGSNA